MHGDPCEVGGRDDCNEAEHPQAGDDGDLFGDAMGEEAAERADIANPIRQKGIGYVSDSLSANADEQATTCQT